MNNRQYRWVAVEYQAGRGAAVAALALARCVLLAYRGWKSERPRHPKSHMMLARMQQSPPTWEKAVQP
jgi:hypothetical protein